MSAEKIKELYQLRENQFIQYRLKIKRDLIWVSVFRFLFFILAISLFVLLVKHFSWVKFMSFIFSMATFIFLVIVYQKKTERLKHIKNLIRINEDEIKVLNHDYSSFKQGSQYEDRDHPYSYDLDLFAQGSLFQYLNRTVSWVGSDLLAARLLSIQNTFEQDITNRQQAISEISKKVDWRQDFMATGYTYTATKDDNNRINQWIDKPIYYLNKLFFKLAVVILPLATLTLIGLWILGVMHYSWFITLALSQLFIGSIMLKYANREQRMVSESLRVLKIYSKLIRYIENEVFESGVLKDLQSKLKKNDTQAQVAFKNLIKIIDAFDTRLNIFLGAILNATLMWDTLSILRLERWKIQNGEKVKGWVEVIAEFDFYISAGTYYYNNPDYIFPEVVNSEILVAEELGHPLIHADKRIANDYKIKKRGEIDIITGANMAGKSTFLRTVGINLIIAANGFPVCAKKFQFQLMNLFTGMRTVDSLTDNESYFYAELKRLKQTIEKVKEDGLTFLLLDEILKGTNSVDKAKGSWKFVKNLISLKATGIIATHDLSLCEMEQNYPQQIRNKCFEVEIDHDNIKFDYKLREGITKNMNASLLMQQMGIFTD